MPFYLKEADILPQLAGIDSALIVPCRFCPAASMAVRENKPYLEPFRRLSRTAAYESFVQRLKRRLDDQGIRTAVFDSKLPTGFVLCLWTAGRRKALAERAAEFDAVVVLGCEGAVQTVRDAVGSCNCRVVQGMDVEGLMNAVPRVSFPFKVSLELKGTTPVRFDDSAGANA